MSSLIRLEGETSLWDITSLAGFRGDMPRSSNLRLDLFVNGSTGIGVNILDWILFRICVILSKDILRVDCLCYIIPTEYWLLCWGKYWGALLSKIYLFSTGCLWILDGEGASYSWGLGFRIIGSWGGLYEVILVRFRFLSITCTLDPQFVLSLTFRAKLW